MDLNLKTCSVFEHQLITSVWVPVGPPGIALVVVMGDERPKVKYKGLTEVLLSVWSQPLTAHPPLI